MQEQNLEEWKEKIDRSAEQITVHSRTYQNTLSKFPRQRKHRMPHMVSRLLVIQEILPFSRCDMDFLFAHHIMENIRIDSCRVDDTSRLIFP